MRGVEIRYKSITVFWIPLLIMTVFDTLYIILLRETNYITTESLTFTLLISITLSKYALVKMNYVSFEPKDIILAALSILASFCLELCAIFLLIRSNYLFLNADYLSWVLSAVFLSVMSKAVLGMYFFLLIIVVVKGYKESLNNRTNRRRRI